MLSYVYVLCSYRYLVFIFKFISTAFIVLGVPVKIDVFNVKINIYECSTKDIN